MDPLTALGLAANIIQFLDFAGKLFSTSKEVYETGAASSSTICTGSQLSDDDQKLQDLANECANVCRDLECQLERLKTDPKQKSKWRTFRAVLRAVWAEDKINRTYKRLQDIRAELSLRLSAMAYTKLGFLLVRHDEQFAQLDRQTATIIQQLVTNPSAFEATIAAQTLNLRDRQDESDRLAMRLQQETLVAIESLRVPGSGLGFGSAGLLPERSRSPTPRPQMTLDQAVDAFLGKLKFRQMSARQEGIDDAHEKTFDWILSDHPTQTARSFSPLRPWLEHGRGCYWISGKAGSGKSTLMKALGSSTKVGDALQAWSGSQTLIVAAFYFWRGGTILQRSQEGLLRWLLYTVLSQQRDLVPVCFPQILEQLGAVPEQESDSLRPDGFDPLSDIVPSLVVVKNMFSRLALNELSSFRIFLLIDGVDEFDGEHATICDFFKNLAGSSSVFKILLSSRPIPACTDAFGGFPLLRLQDLTRNDIRLYVEDMIGRNDRMELLLSEEPKQGSQLTDLIVSKASGVFLWVRLVVRSLLHGLQNFDRISDLRKRIDELPVDLIPLYMYMFQSMETRYQAHGARLLRLVHRSYLVQDTSPLSVLQLAFADDDNLARAIGMKPREMEEKQCKAKLDAMEGRIRSRCCGLIEVAQTSTSNYYRRPDYLEIEVQVLHKSVLDFLVENDVWHKLQSLTPGFNPDKQLMASCLLQLKTYPITKADDKMMQCIVKNCLVYVRHQERTTNVAQIAVMEEVYRAVARIEGNACVRAYVIHREDTEDQADQESRTEDPPPQWLLRSIVEAGLSLYVKHLIENDQDHLFRSLDMATIIPDRLITRVTGVASVPAQPMSSTDTDFYPFVETIRSLVQYLKKCSFSWSVGYVWHRSITRITVFAEQMEDWTQDEVNYNTLQNLVAILEVLAAEISIAQFARFREPLGVEPEYKIISVSRATINLLAWLRGIQRMLALESDSDDVLTTRVHGLIHTIDSWLRYKEEADYTEMRQSFQAGRFALIHFDLEGTESDRVEDDGNRVSSSFASPGTSLWSCRKSRQVPGLFELADTEYSLPPPKSRQIPGLFELADTEHSSLTPPTSEERRREERRLEEQRLEVQHLEEVLLRDETNKATSHQIKFVEMSRSYGAPDLSTIGGVKGDQSAGHKYNYSWRDKISFRRHHTRRKNE